MESLITKKKRLQHPTLAGFGLIEIVVGSAVLSLSLLGISFYYQQALSVSQRTAHTVQAAFLMEEGIEVAKFFRDNAWENISNLTAGTPYYLSWTGSTWATSTTNVFVDGLFERTLVAENVYRDSNDDIVPAGAGILDVGTKKITISVAWNEKGATTTKNVSTYFTDFFE